MVKNILILLGFSLAIGTSRTIATQLGSEQTKLTEVSSSKDQMVFRGPDKQLAVSYTIPANLTVLASCKLDQTGWILLEDGGLIDPDQTTNQIPDCQDQLDPHQLTEEDAEFRLARVNRKKGERDKKTEELDAITINNQDYLVYQDQLLLIDQAGLNCTSRLNRSKPKSTEYHDLAKYQITGKVSCPKIEAENQADTTPINQNSDQNLAKSSSLPSFEQRQAQYAATNDQITQSKIDEAIASGVYTGIDPREKQAKQDTATKAPSSTNAHPKNLIAVDWAKAQLGKAYQPDSGRPWNGWCDRFVALAYGRAFSGYHTAYDHFLEMNRRKMINASREVPAGGLAFFGPTNNVPAGHVMISIGNGQFVSTGPVIMLTDLNMGGLGQYLGWSQPNPEWL
ncbi:C40 family peptidase [Candidatus Nomurabacteria bacterium]|nr:C40 family peptidase [Candidatus Nomurabacteria bacterium]